jgi:hypothetical protein
LCQYAFWSWHTSRTQGVPVSAAAESLGVDARRVRALIARGLLEAEMFGGRWFVDPASVARRSRQVAPDGRPYSPRMAWATLADVAGSEATLKVRGVRPTERKRIRERLAAGALAGLAPRLRGRARTLRLRVHPADVARLEQHPRVVRTGVSAASEHGADISAPGVAEVYVPARSLSALRRMYRAAETDDPNAILHVVDGPWPFADGVHVAPRHVVGVDLLDDDDERTRRAGRELLGVRGRDPSV